MNEYLKDAIGSYISVKTLNGRLFRAGLAAADNIGIMIKIEKEQTYDFVCLPYSAIEFVLIEDLEA